MPRPSRDGKRQPGVSYEHEAPAYSLIIVVRSTHTGTVTALTYGTWRHGDLPLGGHRWEVRAESTKRAETFEHLANLALWTLRQGRAGRWVKKR